jgi:hypothetical protein
MDNLYTINLAAAEALASKRQAGTERPVMLYAFEGFIDSGIAAGLAIGDFVRRDKTERLVTFNTDQLLNYRSRRPPIVYADGGWTSYREPTLAIDLVHDAAGSPFLLMYGPEPDLRWEEFTQAVVGIVEQFDVRLAVGMHGLPSAAPHTRQWRVTQPGNCEEFVAEVGGSPEAKIQLPGSAMALTEFKLRQANLQAETFVVHVPQYLAQMPSPIATVALLREIAAATALEFDLESLEDAAAIQRARIEQQVAENDDLASAIAVMERKYDQKLSPAGPLDLEALSSGDELVAEVERFLASQDPNSPPPAFTD